jgi:hypothetical protein
MKLARVISPILFALLTVVSIQAALAAPPGSTGAGVSTTPKTVSSEDFLCGLSQVATVELPGAALAPKQATENICGTCGINACDNKVVGSRCTLSPQVGLGWCLQPTAATCSDGRPYCDCIKELP